MSNPFYLRKWQILVSKTTDNGEGAEVLNISDSKLDGRIADGYGALRVTFHIEKIGYQAINYADISIYNLTPHTATALIEEGMQVVVNAGYQEGGYGTIFKGTIFQPIRYKENVVDEVLTLHSIDGLNLLDNDFVMGSLEAGSKAQDHIEYAAKNADTQIPIQYITPGFKVAELPRGKVFFGEPRKYFNDAALDNNAQWFVEDG